MTSMESVLITGCSDGSIDIKFFDTARNYSKISYLTGLPNVTLLRLDVVDSSHEKIRHIELNYLVGNAGRNYFMPILDEDLDKVRSLSENNFLSPIALPQIFSHLPIKAGGMAVYITSISGYLNIPYMGTYSASERSLEVVANTLRLKLTPFDVDVLEEIKDTIASRAQGNDELSRENRVTIETKEYAKAVVDEIIKHTTGF
ncbi:putative hydroxybutyrate dehydrogenase [Hypoxylon rubiginosum]|uniref:Hydroxybutyrate dehydrogenase n=1 Tax=Hypoxylon rubiginosum TaxID=110542 RepID=A0ACB9YIG0_9PEZI|nr:putative hydroxybutyrate dehydrogenase [Hypoxylon rubiginosum]